MKTLQKGIEQISFVEREHIEGEHVANKCGRDFLYYALNYYFPETFSRDACGPEEIDKKRLFGRPVPAWLAWTQLQFASAPRFLREQGLRLFINDKEITSYFSFVAAILFSRKACGKAVAEIENCIASDTVCAVDISLGWFGLLDHVLFVYGYDDENLYVIDSHRVPLLEYEQIDDGRFYFKLPKSVVRKRWTKFGRVWRVPSRRRS